MGNAGDRRGLRAARTEVFRGCGVEETGTQRDGSQMEAEWKDKRRNCVLESWEGRKENGDDECAGLGSRGCLLGGKYRAAPLDQRFVKVSPLCFLVPKGKMQWQV